MDKQHSKYRHLRFSAAELSLVCEHCGTKKPLTGPFSTTREQGDDFVKEHKGCMKGGWTVKSLTFMLVVLATFCAFVAYMATLQD